MPLLSRVDNNIIIIVKRVIDLHSRQQEKPKNFVLLSGTKKLLKMLRDINEINWTHAYFNELWYVHFFAVSKNMCCTKLDHSIEKISFAFIMNMHLSCITISSISFFYTFHRHNHCNNQKRAAVQRSLIIAHECVLVCSPLRACAFH